VPFSSDVMALITHRCVDCDTSSPPTEAKYSLLGLAGWRSIKGKMDDGTPTEDWRCPPCWAAHKQNGRAITMLNVPRLKDLLRR
jgi:hypothetical protein